MPITKDYLFYCLLLMLIPFYGLDNFYTISKFLLLGLSFFLIIENIKNNFGEYLFSLLLLLLLLTVIIPKLPIGFFDGLFDVLILFNFSKLKRSINIHKLTFLKYFSLLIVLILFLRMFITAGSTNILNNRFFLGNLDPNLSAVLFFLLYVFMLKIKYRLGTVIVLFSFFLTLSRNFLLGVIVIHILNYFSKKKFYYKFLKYMTPTYSILFLNIILILLIFYTTYLFDIDSSIIRPTETGSIDRVTNFNDLSNYGRFLIIFKAVESISIYPESFLFGIDKVNFMSSPHNTIINLLIYKGFFFTIIILIFVIKTLKTFYLNNHAIIIAYIFMSLFIHSLFNTIYISLLFVFLSTNFNNSRLEIN